MSASLSDSASSLSRMIAGTVASPASLAARSLLAELESTYAMAEERTLHQSTTKPAPQQAEEITFF